MLIDSGLADTHATGNLLEGDTVAEVLYDDVAVEGRLQLVYALIQSLQFLFEPFRRDDRRVEVKQVEAFHPFLYLSAADHVQASVSYACKQIGPGCLFPKVTMIVKKSGEDVVHHILALHIVVQKYGGQPIHLTIMLSEQRFEFPLICHTLLLHTKTNILNSIWQLFSKSA